MIIQNASPANELLSNGALNPKFFGVTSAPSQSRTITVTPPAIHTTVTVQPPPIVQDGVTFSVPPITQDVTIQPPAQQVTIPSTGGDLKNTFESVGIINQGGQIRLCALVRPNVIAAARHYNNPPYTSYLGMAVNFGTETARIVKIALTRDDFECYYLDKAITSVQPAPIAPLQAAEFYASREVIIFGLANLSRPVAAKAALKYAFANGSVFANTPSWIATASNKSNQPVIVQAGDSGSPVFIVSNNVVQYFGSLAAVNLTEIKINVASPHAADIAAL